ncbi:hypothetical protein F4809DRAFT_664168 [Biscogniauxia mediterranea]|nr:hypothetical protein F4809DRAFT_664168 [Biscogniauxia mediterranea]
MVEEESATPENQLATTPQRVQSHEPERIDSEVPNIASNKTSLKGSQSDLKTFEYGNGIEGELENHDSDDGISQATTPQTPKSKGARKKERIKRKKETKYMERKEQERARQEAKEARQREINAAIKAKEDEKAMEKLSQELEQAQRRIEAMQQDYTTLCEKTKSEAGVRVARLSQLEDELENIRTAGQQNKAALVAVQGELDKSQAHVRELEEQLSVASENEIALGNSQSELRDVQRENEKLKETLDQYVAGHLDVQRENEKLKETLDQYVAGHLKELAKAKSELYASEKARASVAKELDEAKSCVTQAAEQVSEMTAAMDAKTTMLECKEDELEECEAELANAVAENKAYQEEMANLEAEIARLKSNSVSHEQGENQVSQQPWPEGCLGTRRWSDSEQQSWSMWRSKEQRAEDMDEAPSVQPSQAQAEEQAKAQAQQAREQPAEAHQASVTPGQGDEFPGPAEHYHQSIAPVVVLPPLRPPPTPRPAPASISTSPPAGEASGSGSAAQGDTPMIEKTNRRVALENERQQLWMDIHKVKGRLLPLLYRTPGGASPQIATLRSALARMEDRRKRVISEEIRQLDREYWGRLGLDPKDIVEPEWDADDE